MKNNFKPLFMNSYSLGGFHLLSIMIILSTWILYDLPDVLRAIACIGVSLFYLAACSILKKLFYSFYQKIGRGLLTLFYRNLDVEQLKRRIEIEYVCYILLSIIFLLNGLVTQFVYLWANQLSGSVIIVFLLDTYYGIRCIKNDCYFVREQDFVINILFGVLGLLLCVFSALRFHQPVAQNGSLAYLAAEITIFGSFFVRGVTIFLRQKGA